MKATEISEEHRELLRARVRASYYKKRTNYLEKAASYRRDNKDAVSASISDWRERNKELVRSQNQAWKAANQEKMKADNAAWRSANKDKTRASWHRHRVKKLENGGTLSAGIEEKLFCLQRGVCVYCRASLKAVGYHLDHIVAVSLGGPNSDENVQLLCPTCNLSKGAKDHINFAQSKGLLL